MYSIKKKAAGIRRIRNGKRFWKCLSHLCGAQQRDLDGSDLLPRNGIPQRYSVRSRFKSEDKTVSSKDSFLRILFKKLSQALKGRAQYFGRSKKTQETYNKLSIYQNHIRTQYSGTELGPQDKSAQPSPIITDRHRKNACTRPGSCRRSNRCGFTDLIRGDRVRWQHSILIIVSIVVLLAVYGHTNALHYVFVCTPVMLGRPAVYCSANGSK